MMMGDSASEKLCCLPAGGANSDYNNNNVVHTCMLAAIIIFVVATHFTYMAPDTCTLPLITNNASHYPCVVIYYLICTTFINHNSACGEIMQYSE